MVQVSVQDYDDRVVPSWGVTENHRAKPIAIEGVKYSWNPRPIWDEARFKMEPPIIGSYGAAIRCSVR